MNNPNSLFKPEPAIYGMGRAGGTMIVPNPDYQEPTFLINNPIQSNNQGIQPVSTKQFIRQLTTSTRTRICNVFNKSHLPVNQPTGKTISNAASKRAFYQSRENGGNKKEG